MDRTHEEVRKMRAQLYARFPRAEAVLYLGDGEEGRGVVCQEGELHQVLDALEKHAGRYPAVRVRCMPGHPDGLVGVVWCACGASGRCNRRCDADRERPKAMLTLSSVDGRPVAIGRTLAPGGRHIC